MKLSKIKSNPNNPRIIKDEKFKKLCESIKALPKMMELRPIVVDDNFIVQGGNMRLKALNELGYKEIPDTWVKQAKDFNEDELKEFIIKDNVGFGEWDWDDLANNWDVEKLEEWGLDIPDFAVMPSEDELTDLDKNNPPTMKITFKSVEDLQQAEIDIRELIDRKYSKAFFSISAGEI